MSKIQLTDTFMDIVTKMSEGNPGTLTVLCELIKHGATIDPDAAMGGMMKILSLDDLGIYGSSIWILFKDICKGNLHDMVALLRANQLGFITSDDIKMAVRDDRNGSIANLQDLVTKVEEALPNFQRLPKESTTR